MAAVPDAAAGANSRTSVSQPSNAALATRHFLVRGFDKVRGEMSLMALCYNFSRVLSILGLDSFMAICQASSNLAILLLYAVTSSSAACKPAGASATKISPNAPTIRPAFSYVLESGWK